MARQILPDDRQQDSILTQIREGMDVYTSDDNHIGKVEGIFFGSVSEQEAELGLGANTPDNPDMRESSWFDELAKVFDPDDIPQELRERYQRLGFIRIDADGLFSSDRYATPDQIASVGSDRVILKTDKDRLLKR
jgi:hypothetical protein